MAELTPSRPPRAESPASASRTLVRRALKASLATLDKGTGHPYASLVTVASDVDGSPLLLISRLALHTQNVEKDKRASLLFDGTASDGDPLAGGRVTLIGTLEAVKSEAVARRFLARHPAAEMYAGFADFSFYRLAVAGAHYVGGFGRIVDLKPEALLVDTSGAGGLIAAESEIVAHMNDDHADAVDLIATRIAGGAGTGWRMIGIDPEGIDLRRDAETARVGFAHPVRSAGEARKELVRLTAEARA